MKLPNSSKQHSENMKFLDSIGNTGIRAAIQNIWIPIRSKITIPFLLLTLAFGIAITYLVSQVVTDTIENRLINQLIETGRISSEFVVLEEDQLLESLRSLAFSVGVTKAIQDQNSEKLREISLPVAVNAQLPAVVFLDVSGNSILTMIHSESDNPEDYAYSKGDNKFAQSQMVQSILNEKVDQYGDKYSGILPLNNSDYLLIAGPIVDSKNELVGVIVVGEPIENLIQNMREATLAQISFYDDQGSSAATTFLESVDSISDEAIISKLLDLESNSYQRKISILDINYRENIGPLILRGDNLIGYIGTALPELFFMRPSNQTLIQLGIFGLVGIILISIIGITLSNRITSPLLKLTKASEKLEAGRYQSFVEPSGNDEVAMLTNSFNRMSVSIFQSQQDLLAAYDETIEGWAKALELKDKGTEGHTRRVTALTVELATALGVPVKEIVNMKRGAMLHDIGKMAIPESILNKPGKLSDEEWKTMRSHPELAYDMISEIEYLKPAIHIPYGHHEKYDGSGYPLGQSKKQIPYQARIFAAIDIWDALSTDRPYRKAWPLYDVALHLEKLMNTHLDPTVVDVFLRMQDKLIAKDVDRGVAKN